MLVLEANEAVEKGFGEKEVDDTNQVEPDSS